MVKVKFIILGGEAREVEVEEGTTIEEAGRRAGLSVQGYSLRTRAPEDVAGPTTPLSGPVAFITLDGRSRVPNSSDTNSMDIVATPKVEAGS